MENTIYNGIARSEKGYFLLGRDGSIYGFFKTYEAALMMLKQIINAAAAK